MPMAPLFSIITVTYNAASTIRPSLESVGAQTCTLYEHIIVDGQSADSTLDIIASIPNPRRRVTSRPDDGIYDAMNRAIADAKGDYLIFLNAGDRFHSPDTLRRYADAIMANDYPGIVYGQTELVDAEGRILGPRHLRAPEQLTRQSFADGMVVCHQAMAVLRRIAPFYNLRYRYSADYEWAIICLQHSRNNICLPCTVIDYLCEGATTAHFRQSLRERFRIMATYYGLIPTLVRHIRFAFRYLRRRRTSANIQ